MALLLRDGDVHSLLEISDTIDALEQAFVALAHNNAVNRPRTRVVQTNGILHVLAASFVGAGVLGLKTYTVFRQGVRSVVMLFSSEDGRLLSLIEAEWLGRMRTGAVSGLATQHLANPQAAQVGLIGAGKQAETQLMGVCAVRPIRTVLVYSRSQPDCEAFCQRMAEQLQIEVLPAASARAAVEDADVVITATNAGEPVLSGEWLKPGCHLNAIGSNWPKRRELDDETLERSSLIVTDSVEQARVEAGDLLIPAHAGKLDWESVWELADVVTGDGPQRNSSYDITVFKVVGVALEDIAVAARAYTRARERGMGEEIDLLASLASNGS
ncbi:MAG TPA: ornithine cyclodeaminase family protein [Ktedonobacteraceae bacterium]|jgi:ornithine cyclodeaminase/alanine dehydrogenase-like protein (mu-crystallin family)